MALPPAGQDDTASWAAANALDKIDFLWPESEAARRAAERFIAELKDEDALVRQRAAMALKRIDNVRAVTPVLPKSSSEGKGPADEQGSSKDEGKRGQEPIIVPISEALEEAVPVSAPEVATDFASVISKVEVRTGVAAMVGHSRQEVDPLAARDIVRAALYNQREGELYPACWRRMMD